MPLCLTRNPLRAVGHLGALDEQLWHSKLLAQPPEPPFPVWLEFVWHCLTPTPGQLRPTSGKFPNVPAASSRCLSRVASGKFSVSQSDFARVGVAVWRPGGQPCRHPTIAFSTENFLRE